MTERTGGKGGKREKKVKKGISLVNGLCMNEPRTVECGGVGVGVWGGRPRGGCSLELTASGRMM